jgi:hypothetical protein
MRKVWGKCDLLFGQMTHPRYGRRKYDARHKIWGWTTVQPQDVAW